MKELVEDPFCPERFTVGHCEGKTFREGRRTTPVSLERSRQTETSVSRYPIVIQNEFFYKIFMLFKMSVYASLLRTKLFPIVETNVFNCMMDQLRVGECYIEGSWRPI